MIELSEKITKSEGNTQTIIPFLFITRHSCEIPISPGIMNPAFSIFLQGTKMFHVRKEKWVFPSYFPSKPQYAIIITHSTFLERSKKMPQEQGNALAER